MKAMTLAARAALRGVLAVGLTTATACSGYDQPNEAGSVGTVVLPLQTTVGDNTYRLQAVFVIRGEHGAVTLSTRADEPTLSTTLATGSYSAFLQSFTLYKDDGTGTFDPVAATAESSTEEFTVFDHSTTTVRFQFDTDGAPGAGGTGGRGTGGTGGVGGSSGSGGSGGAPQGNTCVHVTPGGDDATALATDGAVPFASLQAAVDFASAHQHTTPAVCVASGTNCSAETSYDQGRGDLTLRDGVSVFGGYESLTFTRCGGFGTRLFPSSPAGIQFGPDIVSGAVLDGIAIQTPAGDTAAGVTVDGALGAEIRGVLIEDATHDSHSAGALHSFGVDIRNGADAVIAQSTIFIDSGFVEGIGVRAIGASVSIEQGTWIRNFGLGLDYAVWLENSPNSRITGATLVAAATPPPPTTALGTGVMLRGNDASVQVTDNSIIASGGNTTVVGVEVEDCNGTAPEASRNTITAVSAANAGQNGECFGIRAQPGCPSLIAGNNVLSEAGNGQGAVGIACEDACAVLDNEVSVESLRTEPDTVNRGTGITCTGCSDISGNTVSGLVSVAECADGCEFDSTGISADGEGTVIDSNRVNAGCSGGPIEGPGSVGMRVTGQVRIQNNVITGGHDCPTPIGTSLTTGIVVLDGGADIHSNWIDGGSPTASVCTSTGVSLLSAGEWLLRNNILRPGTCGRSFDVDQSTPSAGRPRLENNAFASGTSTTVLYRMSGAPDATTIDEVNALPNVAASGNFAASCDFPLSSDSPCVNAGTPEAAPDHDIDGDPRSDGAPDVGPDELASP